VLVFLSVSWPWALTFVRGVILREVNYNERDANWIAARILELFDLANRVADYAINLLDHRFGESFGFSADLDIRNFAARDVQAFLRNCDDGWNEFSERAITSTARFSDADAVTSNRSASFKLPGD